MKQCLHQHQQLSEVYSIVGHFSYFGWFVAMNVWPFCISHYYYFAMHLLDVDVITAAIATVVAIIKQPEL